MDLKRIAVVLALALLVLLRNLPGALTCLFPRLLRARPLDQDSPSFDHALAQQMEAELAPLGFRLLGAHLESLPLRRPRLVYDFAHDVERAFASASGSGQDMELYLLTAFEGGGFVLTADHRRISIQQEGRCLSGGLPGATPEQLAAAHRKRVEGFAQAGRKPREDLSLPARVAAAEEWYRTGGAREQRLRHANALILSLMMLAMLSAMVVKVLR